MIHIKYIPKKYTKKLGELDDNTNLFTTWIINRELISTNHKTTLLEVEKICRQYQLYYDKNDNYNLKINGSYNKFKEIFKLTISNYQYNGLTYYAPSTDLQIPCSLIHKLINVIGFNTNTLTQANFKQASYINKNSSFYPLQISQIYKFPKISFVDYNQTIGIIEMGNIDNNIINNIHNYLQTFGINKVPPINATFIDVTDNINNLQENLFLFSQVFIISSLAQNAKINIYYSTNTEYGFYNAINQAIIDNCNIITISWSSSNATGYP